MLEKVRSGVLVAATSLGAVLSARPASAEAGTLVRFTADHPNATLEAHVEGASDSRQWKSICVAPCEERVPEGTALRVKGEGIYASSAFYLPRDRDSVTVHADAATRSGRTVAAIAAVGGGIVFVNGVGFLLAGFALKSVPEFEDSASGYIGVGVVAMAVGATVGIVGLVNLIGNETTTEVTNATTPPRIALGSGFELSPAGLHF